MQELTIALTKTGTKKMEVVITTYINKGIENKIIVIHENFSKDSEAIKDTKVMIFDAIKMFTW